MNIGPEFTRSGVSGVGSERMWPHGRNMGALYSLAVRSPERDLHARSELHAEIRITQFVDRSCLKVMEDSGGHRDGGGYETWVAKQLNKIGSWQFFSSYLSALSHPSNRSIAWNRATFIMLYRLGTLLGRYNHDATTRPSVIQGDT